MNLEEKMALIKAAKDMGLASVKIDGVELILNVAEVKPKEITPVPDLKAEELYKPISPFDEMTPDEMLYYATPYYDELQERKRQHMEDLKNEVVNG